MDKGKRQISLIKTINGSAYFGKLPEELMLRSSLLNQEISLVLDLNILNIMKECLKNRSTIDNVGYLWDFINFINFSPYRISLSPGFALAEVHPSCALEIYYAYEMFVRMYCPNYFDVPNNRKRFHPHVFLDDDLYKNSEPILFFSISILCMMICQIKYKELIPEHKFSMFLIELDQTIGIFSYPIVELAKFIFFDKKNAQEWEYAADIKKIQANFNKRGDLLTATLNMAYDILYLTVTAIQDGKKFDGVVQDIWFVTSDSGLTKFTRFITYKEERVAEMQRDNFMKTNEYWNYCDIFHTGYRSIFKLKDNLNSFNKIDMLLIRDELIQQLEKLK